MIRIISTTGRNLLLVSSGRATGNRKMAATMIGEISKSDTSACLLIKSIHLKRSLLTADKRGK